MEILVGVAFAAAILFLPEYIQHYADSGSHQVGEAVSAEERIADYTLWLTVFTAILAVSTIGLWWQTRQLAKGAETQASDIKISANAANRSADAAVKALVETDRAWIEISANIVAPLDFGSEFVRSKISVEYKNVGKSPAARVSLHGRFYPGINEAIAEKGYWEKTGEQLAADDVGQVLFPGQKADQIYGVVESMKAFGECQNPVFVACVYYRLPSDKVRRRTVMMWKITGASGPGALYAGAPVVHGDARLKLVQHFMGGETT